MLRLLIADDHALVRRQLRLLLERENGWRVCGEAADGEEAVRLFGEIRPDVVVLDFRMPVLDGLSAARRIRDRETAVGIFVITIHPSEGIARQAHEAGVNFMHKSEVGKSLIPAIQSFVRARPLAN
jgi:DNA-binding NarL/FixJ family response regulator